MFGIMKELDVAICADAHDAVERGFVYRPENGYRAVEIQKVVVVQNGTEEGNSTVDLIIVDADGNKSVVMLTGALIKSIPC